MLISGSSAAINEITTATMFPGMPDSTVLHETTSPEVVFSCKMQIQDGGRQTGYTFS